ncbi:MAG TPA: hypothetical protein VKT49_07205 [Bryobacteraceae bacterium]|nr:hypothetical protein [Bryobacteraceae bacterium]
MNPTILKVSVLTDGTVLLNGDTVTLAAFSDAVRAAPQGAVVWYYRENAAADGPPIAMAVMKLVADRRLPVRLSSKPDFSDAIAPASAAARAFAAIRQRAAQRQLVVVRPDGRTLVLSALDKASAPPEAIAAIERLLPSSELRNVAAVADTSWTMSERPGVQEAGKAIPFFGLLMGLASIGHAVWIFSGNTSAILTEGCRDADLAILDSSRLEALPEDWQAQITAAMRRPQLLVHDRATQKLRKP